MRTRQRVMHSSVKQVQTHRHKNSNEASNEDIKDSTKLGIIGLGIAILAGIVLSLIDWYLK